VSGAGGLSGSLADSESAKKGVKEVELAGGCCKECEVEGCFDGGQKV